MSDVLPEADGSGGDDHIATVTVRYWASIRSAAGIDSEQVPGRPEGITLAELLSEIAGLHPEQRFRDQLRICSVLIGSEPVGARDPHGIRLPPGTVVEFLPPFAGG
jgi:molybdopterin synthase sulfur carrier subunit